MPRPLKIVQTETEEPSKTQRKKEMHALQELGEVLTRLSADQLTQLDLSETLLDALLEMQKITRHEAKRRHMQYIGKLMRNVDSEPIREQIERWESGSRANKAAFKAAERWRDRLLSEAEALTAFSAEQPMIERSELEILLNKARLQAERGEAPSAARQLFRMIYRALLRVKHE